MVYVIRMASGRYVPYAWLDLDSCIMRLGARKFGSEVAARAHAMGLGLTGFTIEGVL